MEFPIPMQITIGLLCLLAGSLVVTGLTTAGVVTVIAWACIVWGCLQIGFGLIRLFMW